MALTFRQIDAFTNRPFGGNPAAVCILDAFPDDSWMQALANENNLAETAYVVPRGDGAYDLRWFTPLAEVSLCGHATLASAQALAEEGKLALGGRVTFHTRSGPLTAHRTEDGLIELDFPTGPIEPSDSAPSGLLDALGGEAVYVGRSKLEYELCTSPTESALAAMTPDCSALRRVEMVGVIVTAPADDSEIDFVSRFFAPAVGVDEDHCTGSAHCALACYWSERLGKKRMRARQISPRVGDLEVELRGERVLLRGRAVTTLHAALTPEASPEAERA